MIKLTPIQIILLLVIALIPANCAGIGNNGSTQIDAINVMIEITDPFEEEIIYNDVVPAYLTVEGKIISSRPIRNVTVTYGDEKQDCIRKNEGNDEIYCSFFIRHQNDNITVNAIDDIGFTTTLVRHFTTIGGMYPPNNPWISGYVTDENGTPLTGAQLSFENVSRGRHFLANTTTYSHGEYHMQRTVGFHQKITVSKGGYQMLVLEKTFESTSETQNFVLVPEKTSDSNRTAQNFPTGPGKTPASGFDLSFYAIFITVYLCSRLFPG